ncbi:MAG: hypothetical protein ABSD44_04335 [Terracidiphilus sp.]
MNLTFTATVSICVLFLSTALSAQTSPTKCTSKIYVGILEDAREEMVNWKPGVAQQRLIRPAFEKDCKGWHDVTSSTIPPDLTWTVAFDGRNIGKVRGQAVPIDNNALDQDSTDPNEDRSIGYLTFVQTIVSPAATIPSIGSPSELYGPMGIGPTEGRRPLVVVSAPNVSDPDGWKPIPKPSDKIAALVRSAFRREFPHVDRCKEEEVVQKDWKFPDSRLAFPAVYASNKNTFLVETSLNAGDCGYVDDPNDPLSNPWFFVSVNGHIRRIGSFISLLDAGDYDNDGKSELIFMVNEPEDFDGFALYDANLRKQGSLIWSYH